MKNLLTPLSSTWLKASKPAHRRFLARIMKKHSNEKKLTFGDFVASVYRARGKNKAIGFIRLAIETHLIEFLGPCQAGRR